MLVAAHQTLQVRPEYAGIMLEANGWPISIGAVKGFEVSDSPKGQTRICIELRGAANTSFTKTTEGKESPSLEGLYL